MRRVDHRRSLAYGRRSRVVAGQLGARGVVAAGGDLAGDPEVKPRSASVVSTTSTESAGTIAIMPTPMLSVFLQLQALHVPGLADQVEDRAGRPGGAVHGGVQAVRDHPGQVVRQAAAGDVAEAVARRSSG
ncbi:hypothetical protein SCALM49S_00332 [Streptomyces californicus]